MSDQAMRCIPSDPGLPSLQELFPVAGAPGFVGQMVHEAAGASVEAERATVSYVRYRPTRNCEVLWSFPLSAGQPLLVSGRMSSDGAASPSGYLPQRSFKLQVFPVDSKLTGLTHAASEAWVRETFCRTFGLSCGDVGVTESIPVQYKPWKRCVLRYDLEVQGHPVRYFAKVFRDRRGEPMVARLQTLKAQLVASGAPWDIAAPVVYFPEARMLVLAAVEASEELSGFLRRAVNDSGARETLRTETARVAAGLSAFQRMTVQGLDCVGPHDVLREQEEDLDGLNQVAPALAKSMQVLLRRLESAATKLPAEEMVLCHGAFRYNQFLRRGDTLIALDLDALCLSGASADAGEFLAYLDLTALRRPRLCPAIPVCEEVFLAAVLQPRRDPRWLAWYRAASHVKWAQRSLLSLRLRWPEITEGLLRAAERTLQELPA